MHEYIDDEVIEKLKEIGFTINPERGERSDFFKITITMPHDMLAAIKTFGVERKSMGSKDTDVSSIIREAVAYYLLRWSETYKEKVVRRILGSD